jgi:hypothetical protein
VSLVGGRNKGHRTPFVLGSVSSPYIRGCRASLAGSCSFHTPRHKRSRNRETRTPAKNESRWMTEATASRAKYTKSTFGVHRLLSGGHNVGKLKY